MDNKFIKTSDSDTAEKLKNAGYKLINFSSDGIWTFINNVSSPTVFSGDMKFFYSNVLTF